MEHNQIYYHIDVNNAFLSWESLYLLEANPEAVDLRTIASAVGGDKETRHGIILAKSPVAKTFGVNTAESINEALKKCPHLLVVPPHMSYYKECSKKFIDRLNEIAPMVYQYSIDEAFCDMTGTKTLYGDLIKYAYSLKDSIYRDFGFTVNIGISSNKLLAKMASDFKKPNMVHTLFPEEIPDKMWPLPVGDLFYVGPSTALKLNSLGIYTIGDLANTDIEIIRANFKKHGEVIHQFANGNGLSLNDKSDEQKGYGNSITIPFDITCNDDAYRTILRLCESVGQRLRKDNKCAMVLSLELKDNNFVTKRHQRTLDSYTNTTDELYTIACSLWDKLWDGSPIRLIGVCANKVADEPLRQFSLFDNKDYEKLSKLDGALDSIRDKYGRTSVIRGSLMDSSNDKL